MALTATRYFSVTLVIGRCLMGLATNSLRRRLWTGHVSWLGMDGAKAAGVSPFCIDDAGVRS